MNLLLDVQKKYDEVMTKITESEEKSLNIIKTGWELQVEPELNQLKKVHSKVIHTFKKASEMDTIREMYVTKQSDECIKNIEELKMSEAQNKRDTLKSEIQGQEQEIKQVERELQNSENMIYEDKIPNVVRKELEAKDVDSEFTDLEADELLLGKDIKIKMH